MEITRAAEARQFLSASQNADFVSALRVVLRSYRRGGWLAIGQAADLAGVSVRTLQRRLADEGVAYSEVLQQVRGELAAEMLADTDLSIEQIAKQLGYSTVSNFSRAYHRWTGKRPSEVRGR